MTRDRKVIIVLSCVDFVIKFVYVRAYACVCVFVCAWTHLHVCVWCVCVCVCGVRFCLCVFSWCINVCVHLCAHSHSCVCLHRWCLLGSECGPAQTTQMDCGPDLAEFGGAQQPSPVLRHSGPGLWLSTFATVLVIFAIKDCLPVEGCWIQWLMVSLFR